MKIAQFVYSLIQNNTPMTTEEVNLLRGDAERDLSKLPVIDPNCNPADLKGWKEWTSWINTSWIPRTFLALIYPFANRFFKEYVFGSDNTDDDEIEQLLSKLKK